MDGAIGGEKGLNAAETTMLSVQEETVRVEMQRYSDVIDELKSTHDVRTQLEARCAETSTKLEQTKTTMEDNQRAFDVTTLRVFPLFAVLSHC